MASRRALIAGFVAAGVAALAAGWHFGGGGLFGEGSGRGQDATTLLALRLPNVDGKEEPLEQWRGKLLVVNFWATWCAPCREEMPEFVRFQDEFGAKGLQFVGIAVDDADKVRQFATEIRLNYPALIGGYGAMELSRALGNRVMALPFTIVVGRDGKVAHTHLGPLKSDQLRRIVSQLL
jgi:thiol-disulfide isomerase/thioredoxin